MPRRLVPSGVTGGSSFLLDSLVISEFCCTFAAELRTLAALAVNSVSPERACGALKSLCFSIFLYLCSISEGNDGMLMFLIMRNGGGFHRSFWAAAVGSRD